MNKENLVNFEKRIADLFNSKQIKAPIHLYNGNEEQIQKVFQKINIKEDWVCCTWRNHYQCLLKGVPEELLERKIVEGKSMVMNLSKYKIVSSSIVGGIPSIASGLANSIKLSGGKERVWCWVGDMSAETGAFHEAYKYSRNQNLPITFVVEDNGLSVTSPTNEVWSRELPWYLDEDTDWFVSEHLIYYKYKNNLYPHAGAGIRVQF